MRFTRADGAAPYSDRDSNNCSRTLGFHPEPVAGLAGRVLYSECNDSVAEIAMSSLARGRLI
jgi:hypothetical protein